MKLQTLTGYEERNALFDLSDEVIFRLPKEKRIVIPARNKTIADDFAQILVYRQSSRIIRKIETSESCVVITYNEPDTLAFATEFETDVTKNRRNRDGSTPVK